MNLGWTSERKKFKPWLMINTQKGKERDLLFWTVPRWWILLCMYLYFHYFVRLTNESMTIDQLYTVYSQCTRVHCTLYTVQWTLSELENKHRAAQLDVLCVQCILCTLTSTTVARSFLDFSAILTKKFRFLRRKFHFLRSKFRYLSFGV